MLFSFVGNSVSITLRNPTTVYVKQTLCAKVVCLSWLRELAKLPTLPYCCANKVTCAGLLYKVMQTYFGWLYELRGKLGTILDWRCA